MAADPLPRRPVRANAEEALAGFIRKFDPRDQRLIRGIRKTMRARFPTANELVWDNYNFLVIGYSPTERPSDAPFTVAARANGVGLCFMHGAGLPDPDGILLGSGQKTRFIRLASPEVLARPEVEDLIAAAISRAPVAFPAAGRGKVIVRSVSAKQRPRQIQNHEGRRRRTSTTRVTAEAQVAAPVDCRPRTPSPGRPPR